MKVVNLRKAKAELSALVGTSQRAPVCLTVHGRPVAVLTGTRGLDLEEILLAWDPEFWREIDERTRAAQRDSVTIEELRGEFERARSARAKRSTRSTRKRGRRH